MLYTLEISITLPSGMTIMLQIKLSVLITDTLIKKGTSLIYACLNCRDPKST